MSAPAPETGKHATANALLLRHLRQAAHDICTPRKIVAVAYVLGDALLAHIGFSSGSAASGTGAVLSAAANGFLFFFVGGNVLVLGTAATLLGARVALARLQGLWARETPQFRGVLSPAALDKMITHARPNGGRMEALFNSLGELGFVAAGAFIFKGGLDLLLPGLSALAAAPGLADAAAHIPKVVLGAAFAHYGFRFAIGSAAMLPANWIKHPTPYALHKAWQQHGLPALRQAGDVPRLMARETLAHIKGTNDPADGSLVQKAAREARNLNAQFINFLVHAHWKEHGKEHLLKGSNSFIAAGALYMLCSLAAELGAPLPVLWKTAALATTVGVVYRQGDHMMRHDQSEPITDIWRRERKKRGRKNSRKRNHSAILTARIRMAGRKTFHLRAGWKKALNRLKKRDFFGPRP